MRNWLSITLLLFAFFFSTFVGSQELGNLLKFEFHRKTEQGTLKGCEICFQALGRDNHYKNNNVVISGSISNYIINNNFVLTFKICGYDIGTNLDAEQFEVTYAYPIFGQTYWNKKEDKHAVSDGCSLAMFFNLNAGKFSERFTPYDWEIAYQRRIGGQDVIVPVKIPPEKLDKVSKSQLELSQCVLELIDLER